MRRPPLERMLAALLVAAWLPVAGTQLSASASHASRLLVNASTPTRERWGVNATDNSSALRFTPPRSCRPPAAPAAPLSAGCPVEDASFCDEFVSLDADCSGLLTLPELWQCATIRGYPRAAELQRYAVGSTLRNLYESNWRQLHARYDVDRDGNVTMVDWLAMRGQYVHTLPSCGLAMADPRYRSHKALPIKPCATCAVHWVACDQQQYGGGWTLVYEAAGAVDLRTTSEHNPSLLYTHGWRHTERVEGVLVDVPVDAGSRSYAPVGGKLADESIRQLCDGQYMIVQPGRSPVFCAFANLSDYADDRSSLKHCLDRYHARAQYSTHGWAASVVHTAHGLSPGSSPDGGVLLSLGYTQPGRNGASSPWPHHTADAYAPTGGCVCMAIWEHGGYEYTDGGCHSPDGDRPWCLTVGGCGESAEEKGGKGTFAHCINRCTGSEGCPVQVWCRDNETSPQQYVALEYGLQTVIVGNAFEFFIALSGVSVLCIIGGAVYLLSKIRLQWLGRLKLPPRCALVIESFSADNFTTREHVAVLICCKARGCVSIRCVWSSFLPAGIQLSVSKGDLVRAAASHAPSIFHFATSGSNSNVHRSK